jgi:bacteriocin-like protein
MGAVEGTQKSPPDIPLNTFREGARKMPEQLMKQNDDAFEDITIEELDQISGGAAGTLSSVSCPFCTLSSISED